MTKIPPYTTILPSKINLTNALLLEEKCFNFTSEPSDEEVDYGSFAIDAHPHPLTDSDHARSTSEHDSQDSVTRVY